MAKTTSPKTTKLPKKVTSFRRLLSLWFPVFVWAVVIFTFSAMPTTSTTDIHWQDFIVKKSAHIIEFGILTTLLFRAFLGQGAQRDKAIKYSIILAVLYAFSDEYHQSFTPGRGPHIRDVMIDTFGSLMSMYIIIRYVPKSSDFIKSKAKLFGIYPH